MDTFAPERGEQNAGMVVVRLATDETEELLPSEARTLAAELLQRADFAEAQRIPASEVGTWLDGAMGWHNTYRVIDRAQEYGFELSSVMPDWEANEALTRYREGVASDGEHEAVLELSDAATEYLQTLAPEGYSFVWDAGELSLQADEDLDENGMYRPTLHQWTMPE